MNNAVKIEAFLEIAQKLNVELDSTPILYGSLGLSEIIDAEIKADDIDILIEEVVYETRLTEIRNLMSSLGFELVDARENKFQKCQLEVGIASDGDLPSFAGISPFDLCVVQMPQANYRVLNAEQYLAIYKASSTDGYRKHNRLKNDEEKVYLIEKLQTSPR